MRVRRQGDQIRIWFKAANRSSEGGSAVASGWRSGSLSVHRHILVNICAALAKRRAAL
jgi:hypothetical protein